MIKPIGNKILVKPFPADEESEGGILVPLSARKISNKVLIVETGNGTAKEPMRLKSGMVGFRVKDWKGDYETELIIEGEVHYLIEQSSILATL